MKTGVLLAMTLLTATTTAWARCPEPRPGGVPLDQIPDGARATEAQMVAARALTQEFILGAERYLDCKVLNRRQHNQLVTQLELLAESWKAELIRYQQREQIVADN